MRGATATAWPRPPGPPWADLTIEHPADNRAVGTTLMVAVATDVAVRAGVTGLAGAALVVLAAASLIASRRLVNPQAQVAAIAAPLFGVWLAGRASPWLLALDVLAAAALLLVSASLARGGSVLDLTVPALFWRAVHALRHGAEGLAYLLSNRLPGAGRAAALIRGLALAAPLVFVVGLLLSSADAVFASFFDLSLDPVPLLEHGVTLTVGGWAMAGLLRLSSARPMGTVRVRGGRLGPVEALTVLACLDLLYTAFAAAQLVALSSGGRRVIETSGLTYAAYARRGFFQLLAVAGLTLVVLLVLRAVTDLDAAARRTFCVLGQVAVVLTLLIVVVAARRLHLYEQAFGLTMLRLYSSLFAYWIATVFVLLGCVLGGVWGHRSWLVPAAAGVGLSGLLVLNAVNPEAVVVRHNVNHYQRTGRFDAGYAARLSADAVPALARALPHLDEGTRASLLDQLCGAQPATGHGWLSFNGSIDAATEALNRVCPGPPGS